MYGIYAWNAGAVPAQVTADILALIAGGLVADLSASCNKAATSEGGEASGWSVVDSAYGVMAHAGQAGGPGMLARLTATATPRLQLAAVDGWNMGSHAAGFAATPMDCSGSLGAAGQVSFIAGPAGLLLASSDYAQWALVSEVKRDGPALAGDALAPGGFVVGSGGYCYMPRLKSPSAVGDLAGASVTLQSAYGTLATTAARSRGEALYLPMVPGTLQYSNVPIGELAGPMVAGGYAQSGDYIIAANGDAYQIVKFGYSTLLAVLKV